MLSGCFLSPALTLHEDFIFFPLLHWRQIRQKIWQGRHCSLEDVHSYSTWMPHYSIKNDSKKSFWKNIHFGSVVDWCGVNWKIIHFGSVVDWCGVNWSIHFSEASIPPSVYFSIHPFPQTILALTLWCGKKLTHFLPPNSSDDLCRLFGLLLLICLAGWNPLLCHYCTVTKHLDWISLHSGGHRNNTLSKRTF